MRVPQLDAHPVTLRPWAVEDAEWFVAARDDVVGEITTHATLGEVEALVVHRP